MVEVCLFGKLFFFCMVEVLFVNLKFCLFARSSVFCQFCVFARSFASLDGCLVEILFLVEVCLFGQTFVCLVEVLFFFVGFMCFVSLNGCFVEILFGRSFVW